jgi:hypothetical protein
MPVKDVPDFRHDRSGSPDPAPPQRLAGRLAAVWTKRDRPDGEPQPEPAAPPKPRPVAGGAAVDPTS